MSVRPCRLKKKIPLKVQNVCPAPGVPYVCKIYSLIGDSVGVFLYEILPLLTLETEQNQVNQEPRNLKFLIAVTWPGTKKLQNNETSLSLPETKKFRPYFLVQLGNYSNKQRNYWFKARCYWFGARNELTALLFRNSKFYK